MMAATPADCSCRWSPAACSHAPARLVTPATAQLQVLVLVMLLLLRLLLKRRLHSWLLVAAVLRGMQLGGDRQRCGERGQVACLCHGRLSRCWLLLLQGLLLLLAADRLKLLLLLLLLLHLCC